VTAERARPWWASDGPVDGGIDRRTDPLELHRAARRGPGGDAPWWAETPAGPAGQAGPASEPADEPPHGSGGADQRGVDQPVADEPSARHGPDVCGVCPVCSAVRLLQESRPELVEHLTEAARHLAAAARSLLEPPTVPTPPTPRADGAADGGLRRIRLDDHAGHAAGSDDPNGASDPPGPHDPPGRHDPPGPPDPPDPTRTPS
jgi:hypothetical protein